MLSPTLPEVHDVKATLMLCRQLGISIGEEEIASILRDATACFLSPRNTVVRLIAGRMCQPGFFYCSEKTLAHRAQLLDWNSPRFFGYDEQMRREASYLLPAPLTMHTDFSELVSPIIRARTYGTALPHNAPLFVALIEAFLCRCVIFNLGLREHSTAIINTVFYAPLGELTASLYRVIANAVEAGHEE